MYALEIIRCDVNPDKDYIFGDARLFDSNYSQIYKCVSLERFSKRIPEGVYIVDITYSPKFKRYLLHVCDVQGRTGIRIHPFNRAHESLGCIALGEYRSGISLFHSSIACNHVKHLVEKDCGRCILKIK